MSKQQLSTITRKARIWPEIPKASIYLPNSPTLMSRVSPLMLISAFSSMTAIGIYALILPKLDGNNFFFIDIMMMSGGMILASLASFFMQWIPANRRKRSLMLNYTKDITKIKTQLQELSLQERQGQLDLDPPLIMPEIQSILLYEQMFITPIMQRSFTNQDIQLWSRRPDDPDFLAVRVGMGQLPPSFTLKHMQQHTKSDLTQAQIALLDEQEEMIKQYAALTLPIRAYLGEYSVTAILGKNIQLSQARQLAMTMIAYLAYHHSPEDVRFIILAPEAQRKTWEWAALLPHTTIYDPKIATEDNEYAAQQGHAVAIGNEAVLTQLPLISREVSRRELLLGDTPPGMQSKVKPMLPRLVIVVDRFDEEEDLDRPSQFLLMAKMPGRPASNGSLNRPRLTIPPLRRAEMTLALNAEKALGISVLALCGNAGELPPATRLLIEIENKESRQLGAAQKIRIRHLQLDAPATIVCDWPDNVPLAALRQFANNLHNLRPSTPKRLELRTQVDICALFEPYLDLANYDPSAYWKDTTLRAMDGTPLMRVPIGLKIGDETQYLDLLKDGPHGLLIGQTGSGKSELLQTIITALAIAYQPNEVNFLLIDYKAGLALEPFSRLPHTIGFLSNVSSTALIERFITMLRAEAMRREIRLKEGKTTPRLVIIIDEFAEMVKRTENVLDELFTITRVGREIGMHLLLAAQRPEGIIGSKVRDYVQYRLCLRCASPEDSREVLHRVDAASLPASIPGRGYLLHGDNQLDLFQAARVTIQATPAVSGLFSLAKTHFRTPTSGTHKEYTSER